jgi:hypothetical protein
MSEPATAPPTRHPKNFAMLIIMRKDSVLILKAVDAPGYSELISGVLIKKLSFKRCSNHNSTVATITTPTAAKKQ